MSADPLAAYRKTPLVPPTGGPPTSGRTAYAAFHPKDHAERLRIRCANKAAFSADYLNMPLMVYDEEFGNYVTIIFSLVVVFIEGKNLQTMITAIESRMVDYIQEFDPARWDAPKDSTAPIIESIRVIVQPGGPVDESGERIEDFTIH